MKLLKEIFKRPLAVGICVALFFVFGIYASLSMPVALLPNMTLPYVCVTTPYVGASAATVDAEATTPLYNACRSVSDVNNVNSYSIDNASVILVEFDYGVNLEEKIETLRSVCANVSLPAGCGTSAVTNFDLSSSAVTTLSVFSASDNPENVYYDALALQSALKNISGVGDATLTGAPEGRVSVSVKQGFEPIAPLLVQALAATGQDLP